MDAGLRDESDAETWMEGREMGIAMIKGSKPEYGRKNDSLIRMDER